MARSARTVCLMLIHGDKDATKQEIDGKGNQTGGTRGGQQKTLEIVK
jgi:hypothetical protein